MVKNKQKDVEKPEGVLSQEGEERLLSRKEAWSIQFLEVRRTQLETLKDEHWEVKW